MFKINPNYANLEESYLFATVADKTEKFMAANPDKKVLKLSIGDVTLPLSKAVISAMEKASREMGESDTFRGYGPYRGYDFLQKAIASYYLNRGVSLELDEIFVSDGAKADLANILEIFSRDNTVLIPDPVYPVYVDTNIMAGRSIKYMNALPENDFLPLPDETTDADIIYICSPNNPTGAVYDRASLKKWVDFANEHGSVILFDNAYEAFIEDENCPHSIYEIEGAKTCAIEISSLSKSAGFTGTRMGYTIVPLALRNLNSMWYRHQSTAFNGSPYIIQRGAEAHFSPEGQKEAKEKIAYYKNNAKIITEALDEIGISYIGGKSSPYVWMKCPSGMTSWEYFDYLLNEKQIVGTPGSGFGKNGEGFFRLTSFGKTETVLEAVSRLKK